MGLAWRFKELKAAEIDELIRKPRKLQAFLVGDEANGPTEADIDKA